MCLVNSFDTNNPSHIAISITVRIWRVNCTCYMYLMLTDRKRFNKQEQLTFLRGIGSSEMEKEMQKIVKNVMTEVEEMMQTLENTTGIESSFQEQDIKRIRKDCYPRS